MAVETPLLRAKEIFPTNAVIESVLGEESFPIYENLINTAIQEHGLFLDWYYYKDQKTWLCKVLHKKKNVFWVSIWDKFFKITFYFTEKHFSEFEQLDVKEDLKFQLRRSLPIGKLIPLVIKVTEVEQLKDILTIVVYKKSLK
jgi:hypothetical protein